MGQIGSQFCCSRTSGGALAPLEETKRKGAEASPSSVATATPSGSSAGVESSVSLPSPRLGEGTEGLGLQPELPSPQGEGSSPEKELPVPALQGPDLPTRDDRAGPPEPPPGALPGPSPESELPAPGGEATDGLATEPTPAVSGDQPSAPKMEVKTEDVEEASTGTITPPASPRTIAPAPAQPKGKGKGKGAKGKAPVAKAKPKASTARTSLPKALIRR
ncbi:unnamed protein product [Durusdinium trenchii]|uniref:Uncharacterized protein n=1 Tax=Durusdinium trenchii TaxID=1381693 RepID=A0ABP0QE72_9DINO